MTKKSHTIYLLGIGLLLAISIAWYWTAFHNFPLNKTFDGQQAYEDVKIQVAFGPRSPGTPGHAHMIEWIQSELSKAGWDAQIQSGEILEHTVKNIVASRSDLDPAIIIAAHYDTRMFADEDPDMKKISHPVPGGNDGASGVAVLLELARVLPQDSVPIWLVFFDAEDNGRLPGWDWILGSKVFVAELTETPEAVVIVDMIGDADLNIYKERTSDQELTDEIWELAAELGYQEFFIPEYKYSILDDHTPFLSKGIPAIDIIDFDYPYWHTTQDTADKVSAESLEVVGRTLQVWIMERSELR